MSYQKTIIKYFDEVAGKWFDIVGDVGSSLVLTEDGWTSQQVFKKYVVSLTQTSTGSPIINKEFLNNIGNIVWSRNAVGDYNGFLTDGFIGNISKSENVFGMIDSGTINYVLIEKIDNSNIRLRTLLSDGSTTSDNLLKETTIEITIY